MWLYFFILYFSCSLLLLLFKTLIININLHADSIINFTLNCCQTCWWLCQRLLALLLRNQTCSSPVVDSLHFLCRHHTLIDVASSTRSKVTFVDVLEFFITNIFHAARKTCWQKLCTPRNCLAHLITPGSA